MNNPIISNQSNTQKIFNHRKKKPMNHKAAGNNNKNHHGLEKNRIQRRQLKKGDIK